MKNYIQFAIIFLYNTMQLVACFFVSSFDKTCVISWNIVCYFAGKKLSKAEILQLCDNFLQHCGLGVRGEKYMVYMMAGL